MAEALGRARERGRPAGPAGARGTGGSGGPAEDGAPALPDPRQLSLFAADGAGSAGATEEAEAIRDDEPSLAPSGQLSLLSPAPHEPAWPSRREARRTRAAEAHPPEGGPSPDAFRAQLAGFADLTALADFAAGCRRCGLRAGCRGVVFGEGDPKARLFVVGEGPGAREDELGRPFVGRAGELLDRILAAAGFRREEVYITNVVMCRPPGNRTPEPAEVEACRPYLERKIELVDPQVIVALGATAARALIGPHARITAVRGRWHDYRGRPVMPTFHPALLLRDPSRKREVWQDFQAVRDAVRGARA
ncbi:MAG: uracil-DNA glycosylase, partial [Clostridia bacterium]|nr:uracil-DNA glycosylase [Clostridia bacterium]